jgi:hypothetical protein
VWCTGVGRTLKDAEAVAIGEAVCRTARHQASESADGAAAECRRMATPRRVAFDNELERWRAFCELAGTTPARDAGDDRSSHAVAEACVVLVDCATGKRFVGTGWFAGYVKREVGGLYSPAALATQMERVGWTGCNSQGRINGTTPSNGQRLSWRFHAVPGRRHADEHGEVTASYRDIRACRRARRGDSRTAGNSVTGKDAAG